MIVDLTILFVFLLCALILYLIETGKSKVDTIIDNSIYGKNPSQRNNNPGNLVYMKQPGAIGKDKAGFAIFETAEKGWNALYNQIILEQKRGHTLKSFIYKYAPPSENNTEEYLSFLKNRLYANNETGLKNIDVKDLAEALARYEGYYV